jgi:hypothetical protein
MSGLFFADLHVGNHRVLGGPFQAGINKRCRDLLGVYSAVLHAADDADADLFSLGDLIDTTHPPPQVLTALQKAHWSVPGVRAHLMMGNHERVSATMHDDSLSPLGSELPHARVYREPTRVTSGSLRVGLVPFDSGPASSWLEDAVAEVMRSGPVDVLCLHLGLRDASFTAPWAQAADDAVDVDLLDRICGAHGIRLVLAGNWHTHRVFQGQHATMVQLGALAPTGFDNPGLEGYGLAALVRRGAAGPELSFISIRGPRFLQLRASDDLSVLASEDGLVYGSVAATPAELADVRQRIDHLRVGSQARVVVDKVETAKQAQQAGAYARQAESLEQAVMLYMRPLQLVSRKDFVQARVLRCLGLR